MHEMAADWLALELGPTSSCPYLPGRLSQLTFSVGLPSPTELDALLARGYRRLGYVFYVPSCPGCRECVPLRVLVDQFTPSRSQRRLLRRFGPLYEVRELRPQFKPEHFALYARHARQVSSDNDPGPPSGFRTAFVESAVTTHFFEFRIKGVLAGVSVLDEGARAVSSVYAFWDPDLARYSPGTFSALWELEWAKRQNKTYYHLGYWVRECPRMRYKSAFRPHELYDWTSGSWTAPAEASQAGSRAPQSGR